MTSIKTSQKNVNIGGDYYQTILTSGKSMPLTRTQVYDCLTFFIENIKDTKLKNIDISTLPATLNKKLCFNHAGKYINIFKNHYLDIELVGNVIQNEFSDSGEIIISDLKDQFYNIVPYDAYDDSGNFKINNGDEILDVLYEKLLKRVQGDQRFTVSKVNIEILKKFLYAFIGYGVKICQILVNPNKESKNQSDIS